MDCFLENVEFRSRCQIPSLYCSVSEQKCVAMHKIFSGLPLCMFSVDARYWYGETLSSISVGHKLVWFSKKITCVFVFFICLKYRIASSAFVFTIHRYWNIIWIVILYGVNITITIHIISYIIRWFIIQMCL
jgi:hypothetical protein